MGAPFGRVAALLTGHTHKDDFTMYINDAPDSVNDITILACNDTDADCWLSRGISASNSTVEFAVAARGAVQYITKAALCGGSRLLSIRCVIAGSSGVRMDSQSADNNEVHVIGEPHHISFIIDLLSKNSLGSIFSLLVLIC